MFGKNRDIIPQTNSSNKLSKKLSCLSNRVSTYEVTCMPLNDLCFFEVTLLLKAKTPDNKLFGEEKHHFLKN